MAAALPLAAFAQGVPIADGKSIIQHSLEIAQMSYLTGARELEADKKARIAELHQEQLDALTSAEPTYGTRIPCHGNSPALVFSPLLRRLQFEEDALRRRQHTCLAEAFLRNRNPAGEAPAVQTRRRLRARQPL